MLGIIWLAVFLLGLVDRVRGVPTAWTGGVVWRSELIRWLELV
jgi:hypothetical protein